MLTVQPEILLFVELCHVDVQPEMAMKVCLSVLTHTWCSDNWGACVRLLLLWIQHDLQPAFFTPVKPST